MANLSVYIDKKNRQGKRLSKFSIKDITANSNMKRDELDSKNINMTSFLYSVGKNPESTYENKNSNISNLLSTIVTDSRSRKQKPKSTQLHKLLANVKQTNNMAMRRNSNKHITNLGYNYPQSNGKKTMVSELHLSLHNLATLMKTSKYQHNFDKCITVASFKILSENEVLITQPSDSEVYILHTPDNQEILKDRISVGQNIALISKWIIPINQNVQWCLKWGLV